MAKRSLSSLKRARQNVRRRERNKSRKGALKTQIRKFMDALAAAKPDVAAKEFGTTGVLLDRAAAHGVIHRNTASRKKSRLARRMHTIKAGKK